MFVYECKYAFIYLFVCACILYISYVCMSVWVYLFMYLVVYLVCMCIFMYLVHVLDI